MSCRIVFYLIIFAIFVCGAYSKIIVSIDEHSICAIKKSCLECLQLDQCSWCASSNKCFSVNTTKDICDEPIKSAKHDLSLYENANCACNLDEVKKNCNPPGVEGPECYGRGTCVCGRCSCHDTPDPENPSKVIIGEYCEYDNFSCDGPQCNEGPYPIHDFYERKNQDDIFDIATPLDP